MSVERKAIGLLVEVLQMLLKARYRLLPETLPERAMAKLDEVTRLLKEGEEK